VTGVVAWFTGLPASGKSTLAWRTRARLVSDGVPVVLLDGDEVRRALVPAPGYAPAERDDFYETLARLAALLASQGFAVLVAATAHRRAHRQRARALAPCFVEVHVATPPEACEGHDVKGLWAAARAGRAPLLPGVGLAYEPPEAPEVVASGGLDDDAVGAVVAAVKRLLTG
jgi:adenylylsulfate kinase